MPKIFKLQSGEYSPKRSGVKSASPQEVEAGPYLAFNDNTINDVGGLSGYAGAARAEAYREIHKTVSEGMNIGRPDVTKEYYVIGRRPLEALPFADKLYRKDSPGVVEHRHFIANDGSNIGRTTDGLVVDTEENLRKGYEHYDYIRYDAKLIDEAISIYKSRFEPDSSQFTPRSNDCFNKPPKLLTANEYRVAGQNCQHFIKEVLTIAEELSKKSGRQLVIGHVPGAEW